MKWTGTVLVSAVCACVSVDVCGTRGRGAGGYALTVYFSMKITSVFACLDMQQLVLSTARYI